jgi:hypothetical protein
MEFNGMGLASEVTKSNGEDAPEVCGTGASSEQISGLVFIDPTVPEQELLLRDLPAQYQAICLTDQTDAIDQITNHLRDYEGLEALHIVTHGSPGQLHFSNAELSSDTINQYWDQLARWSAAMAEDADILLYGCETGQGEVGHAFIGSLSNITGCNIAAADSYIGHSSLGADWLLTQVSGTISSSVFAAEKVQAGWNHHLADVTIGNTAGGGGVSSGNSVGQSFTATKTGLIKSISIASNLAQSETLKIYAGEGIGGSLLHTQSVNLTDSVTDASTFSLQELILDAEVAITSGSQYTFAFSGAAEEMVYAGSSVYVDGIMFVGASAQSTLELVFEVVQSAAGPSSK